VGSGRGRAHRRESVFLVMVVISLLGVCMVFVQGGRVWLGVCCSWVGACLVLGVCGWCA